MLLKQGYAMSSVPLMTVVLMLIDDCMLLASKESAITATACSEGKCQCDKEA